MSNKENFVSCLVLGQYYEQQYIEHRKFTNVHHPKDKCFKDYDFKNLDTNFSYEVKADKRAKDTGNLFIEFECSGIESGINSTKANYWIHFITKDDVFKSESFIKIKCKKLIDIINKNNYRISKGGDNYKARGFLVPVEDLKQYSNKCKI